MEELLFRPFPSKAAHYTEFPADATHEWPLTIPVHLNPLPQAHPCTGGTHHGLRLSSSATSSMKPSWMSPHRTCCKADLTCVLLCAPLVTDTHFSGGTGTQFFFPNIL